MKMERKVEDESVMSSTSIKQLVEEYRKSGGFTAKKLATASDIMKSMLGDKECLRILSFPACIISTGTRGIIREAVKRKMFDIVMTTCGTLDHDFARAYNPYYHGRFEADDRKLHEQGIYRLGNIFIPHDNYGGIIEEKLQPMLKEIYDSGMKEMSTSELCRELGKRMPDNSILHWAAKNDIPIVIPGITDGAFGFQLLMFMEEHKDFKVDVFRDEKFLLGKLFRDDVKAGALMVGGGISKHHVIWWAQFCGGLHYAVYVTTAVEHDGSLSGARMREAVSWGKVEEKAKYITVEGDATILLPLVLGPHMD